MAAETKKETIHFHVGLARLVLEVDCCCEATKHLCDEYQTEAGPADHSILITPADIRRERERLRERNDPGAEASEQAIESLSLCRRIAEFLPNRDRVLFHGSCLAYEGQGVLFTAKSGTGKSTHTRLWREVFGERVMMVNDDKPFLHIAPNGVTAWGTPWRGKHGLGSNCSVPLKAICVVCRGTENRVERISPREALPVLLQQTYRPQDREALGQTLTLIGRLSERVSLYRLYCNMDAQAAMTAREGIFGKPERG